VNLPPPLSPPHPPPLASSPSCDAEPSRAAALLLPPSPPPPAVVSAADPGCAAPCSFLPHVHIRLPAPHAPPFCFARRQVAHPATASSALVPPPPPPSRIPARRRLQSSEWSPCVPSPHRRLHPPSRHLLSRSLDLLQAIHRTTSAREDRMASNYSGRPPCRGSAPRDPPVVICEGGDLDFIGWPSTHRPSTSSPPIPNRKSEHFHRRPTF
jgi:hypothetical protein